MTKNQRISGCGVQERNCFEWGPEEAAAYRKSLGDAMLALRASVVMAPPEKHASIREEWARRQVNWLDGFYLSSTMKAAAYRRYLAKIDKVTIEA